MHAFVVVPVRHGGTRRVGCRSGGSWRRGCRKASNVIELHHNPARVLEEATSVLGVSSPAELAVSLCKVKAAGSASSGFRGNPR